MTTAPTPATRLVALAWAGVAFAAPLTGIRPLGPVVLYDILLVVAVAVTAVAAPSAGRRPFAAPGYGPVLAGLSLLAAGALLGAAFARQPGASLTSTGTFLFTTAGSLVAVALWRPTRREIRWFFLLFLAGVVGNALYAAVASPTVAGRRFGLASHPNSLGLVCVLGTGVALGLVLAARGLPRLVTPVVAGILVAGLVASGSRAALLGMAAAGPAVALLSSHRRMAVATTALAALAAAAVVVGVARGPVHDGLGRMAGDRSTAESDAQRLGQLVGSLDRVHDRPLTGVGLQDAEAAHSIYLQALVAAGPLGLIGMALIIWGILGAARLGIASMGAPPRGDAALLAGLTGGYVGYLVAAAFQNSLSHRAVWIFVAGTLALAGRLYGPSGHPPPILLPALQGENDR